MVTPRSSVCVDAWIAICAGPLAILPISDDTGTVRDATVSRSPLASGALRHESLDRPETGGQFLLKPPISTIGPLTRNNKHPSRPPSSLSGRQGRDLGEPASVVGPA